MDFEPYSLKCIFEGNCDVISEWLSEEQINRVENIEIKSRTGNVYDEKGEMDENETMVARWEDMAHALIAQDLLSWQRLKEFYTANQEGINETFMQSLEYQKLYSALADGYEIESSMVCISAFAVYNWCFAYRYRTKRLEYQS